MYAVDNMAASVFTMHRAIFNKVNVGGTQTLIEACREAKVQVTMTIEFLHVHKLSVNRISLKNKLASYQTKHVDQLLNRKGITQH